VLVFLPCLGLAAILALATRAAFFVTFLVGFFLGSVTTGGGMKSPRIGVILILGAIGGLAMLGRLLRDWFAQPAHNAVIRKTLANPSPVEPTSESHS
jgi:hypothetical protein